MQVALSIFSPPPSQLVLSTARLLGEHGLEHVTWGGAFGQVYRFAAVGGGGQEESFLIFRAPGMDQGLTMLGAVRAWNKKAVPDKQEH